MGLIRLNPEARDSMWPSEHEGEGYDEQLIAEIIVDMQDPLTPILEAARPDQGPHDACRAIACFGKIFHCGAAAVDQRLLRVGAVEIHLGHTRHLTRVAAMLSSHSASASGARREAVTL